MVKELPPFVDPAHQVPMDFVVASEETDNSVSTNRHVHRIRIIAGDARIGPTFGTDDAVNHVPDRYIDIFADTSRLVTVHVISDAVVCPGRLRGHNGDNRRNSCRCKNRLQGEENHRNSRQYDIFHVMPPGMWRTAPFQGTPHFVKSGYLTILSHWIEFVNTL